MAAKHVHSMPFYVGNILPKKKKKRRNPQPSKAAICYIRYGTTSINGSKIPLH